MHLNSELLFCKYASPYFKEKCKVLEIGPLGFPSAYQKIINNPAITWHTIDFEGSNFIDTAVSKLTYKLESAYHFPVEDESYDIVLSGQVIEHVGKIWMWLKELKRVTKINGIIITINPVSWPYHEAPIDCWRIFPAGIKALAEEVELNVELCLFESLEKEHILKKDLKSKFIPGQAYNYHISPNRINALIRWNKAIRKLPLLRRHFEIPIEISYDTVSILKKNK